MQTHRKELLEFVQRHHVEVIIVNEIDLPPSNLPNCETACTTTRGTAIFIKLSAGHYVETTPNLLDLEDAIVIVRTAARPTTMF